MAGFAPLQGPESKVLILGSMPSQASLTKQQYYANPQNSFWWIMSVLAEFDLQLCYADKVARLTHKGIAVWDVLHDCERPGSLDSAIVSGTEVVNDFAYLLDSQPTLKRLIFNGAAAEKIFLRDCKDVIETCVTRNIDWLRCPSTSPAHASMNKQQKLKHWRAAISDVL